MMYCGRCGAPLKDAGVFCGVCGNMRRGLPTAYQNTIQPAAPVFPMKWYNFIVYCHLFLYVAAYILNAISYLFGLVYSGNADAIYHFNSELRIIDILFAVVFLALAGFALYTRHLLVKYKKEGPKCFLILLIAGCVAGIFRSAVSVITFGGTVLFIVSAVFSIALITVEFILTRIYFKKRASLFINE